MRARFICVCLGVWMVHLKPMAQKSVSAAERPCDSTVVVTGVVTDLGERWIPSSMVVNRRTNAGEFVGSDGEFIVRACLGDTLVIGAVGYHTQEHRVRSGDALRVELRVLNVEVGAAEVIAPRTLNEIIRDIQALGYREEDFRVSGIDALEPNHIFVRGICARGPKPSRSGPT